MSNELVTIEKSNVLAVFTTEKGLDPLLAKVRNEIDSFVPDVTTKKGRDEIASIAYKVAQTKSYLDKTGKELVDQLKQQPKMVDSERKRMRDTLDAWRDEVRAPLTALEDAEKEVLTMLQLSCDVESLTSAQIKERIYKVEQTDISFAVVKPKDLEKQLKHTLDLLAVKFAEVESAEVKQAEIERLQKEAAEREQKEREERIAREAAERARIEAETKARLEAERIENEKLKAVEAAERAERERVESEQRAERLRIEAEQRAEREKLEAIERERRDAERREQMRIQAEQQARLQQEEAERKRKADYEHRRAVNNAILSALTQNGVQEDVAKQVISLAAQCLTANLVINY